MITLASDFGSPYPAAMKGVIARRCDADVVDVAHDLPRQDVRTAAFWLRFVLPEFPPAVHCAVIDPGVGTDRAALVVRAGDHALVGPDNGVLLPAARALATDRQRPGQSSPGDSEGSDPIDVEVFVVEVADPESSTFHGRDVFAPAAADVHAVGVDGLERIDRVRPADDHVDCRLPEATVDADGARAEVLAVDGFGNVITNVPGDDIEGYESVVVDPVDRNGSDDEVRAPVVGTFAAVDPGRRLATVGSHGYLELDVNRGRGDEAFGLSAGDELDVRFE